MDFVGLFGEYAIGTSHASKGWINVCCPYCGSGESHHMGFNVAHDYCNCFKCGHRNLRDALAQLLNMPEWSLDGVLEPYQGRASILSRLNEKKPPNKKKIELPGYPLSVAEKNYLLGRRFDPKKLVRDFGIQGGGWVGEWKNRIIIPIYLGGKLASWTSRTIIEGREPRYKNLQNEKSVIDPKKIFFNLDNCSGKAAALLEGPFDVLRFGDGGICGFGITLTRVQLNYLSKRFKKLFILFDSGREAQKKAREHGMLLQGQGVDVYLVDAFSDYGCKDAGEMSPFKIKALKRELFGSDFARRRKQEHFDY